MLPEASVPLGSPSHLQPGAESLDVGHGGVLQWLLEHTQQQTVGQGPGQRNRGLRGPNQGRPGERAAVYRKYKYKNN